MISVLDINPKELKTGSQRKIYDMYSKHHYLHESKVEIGLPWW